MLPPCPQVHSRFVILGVGSPFLGLGELRHQGPCSLQDTPAFISGGWSPGLMPLELKYKNIIINDKLLSLRNQVPQQNKGEIKEHTKGAQTLLSSS